MRAVLARISKLEARRAPRRIVVVVIDPEREDPQLTISRKLAELGRTRDDNIMIYAVRTGVPRGPGFGNRSKD
jgi:hypothetical protein